MGLAGLVYSSLAFGILVERGEGARPASTGGFLSSLLNDSQRREVLTSQSGIATADAAVPFGSVSRAHRRHRHLLHGPSLRLR